MKNSLKFIMSKMLNHNRIYYVYQMSQMSQMSFAHPVGNIYDVLHKAHPVETIYDGLHLNIKINKSCILTLFKV